MLAFDSWRFWPSILAFDSILALRFLVPHILYDARSRHGQVRHNRCTDGELRVGSAAPCVALYNPDGSGGRSLALRQCDDDDATQPTVVFAGSIS